MFEEANKLIKDYGEKKLAEAQAAARGMGISHRSNSPSPDESISGMKVSFSQRAHDLISVIKYSLRRTLFYTYHGAGWGFGGKKGSTWTTTDGDRKKTDPRSLGKAGSGARTAKPFLDVIAKDAEQLMDDVAAANMDYLFNNSFKNFK